MNRKHLRCLLCTVTPADLLAVDPKKLLALGIASGEVPHRLCPRHATEVWRLEQVLRGSLELNPAPRPGVHLTVIDGGREHRP